MTLSHSKGTLLLISTLLLLLFSCKKETTQTNNTFSNDCVFVQNDADQDGIIDDAEMAIMTDCRNNPLATKSEIEANLIGEWELVGHGQGWIVTPSQPCGYITISEDSLVLEFTSTYVDTIITNSWEIGTTEWQGEQRFHLDVTESFHGLYMNQFCESYMYGDATPSDGNMYLYQKIE